MQYVRVIILALIIQEIYNHIFYTSNMTDIIDQQLEAMFHATTAIQEPDLKCCSDHIIDRLCVNKECKQFSLHCSNKNCQGSFRKHILCKIINFDGITYLLNKPLQSRKQFLRKLFQIQNQTIEKLKNERIAIIKRLSFGTLMEKHQKIVKQIYTHKNLMYAKGNDIKQFYSRLIEEEKIASHGMDKLLEYFAGKHKALLNQMVSLKEEIFTNFLEGKQTIKNQLFISKIINEEKSMHQKINFIDSSLNYPKSIELLYRGSENGFSAEIFHQKCDNIEGTLTLIRTEFGKTIGGFTPIKWNQQNGWYADASGRSFLFSLNLMQKMDLIQKQKAIYCNSDIGPIFGGGADICLSDKCNQNCYSYCKFPVSYNFAKIPYTDSQKSFTAFCGAIDGNNFKVVEYEVFRVI